MRFSLASILGLARKQIVSDQPLLDCIDQYAELRVEFIEPESSIAISSVPRWHDWSMTHSVTHFGNRAGVLNGHRYDKAMKRYTPYQRRVPALASFVTTKKRLRWTCDIQDVVGVAASKAPLSRIPDMDTFAERYCIDGIRHCTPQQLARNLSHSETRIVQGTGDSFIRHAWDGDRLFLVNSGGSHHFASVRYVAGRLGQEIPLTADLTEHCINSEAVHSLTDEFDMFVCKALDWSRVTKGTIALRDALQSLQAPYLSYSLPRPYPDDQQVIFLPKDEPQSCKAAQVLRETGFVDFGMHLQHLLERQKDAGIDMELPSP